MNIPDFRLDGKIALVTGSTKGLGYGMATGLAQAGANLVIVSRTPADCDRVAEELKATGADTLAAPTDVTDQDAVQALVEKALDKFGRIDILVNNAGSAISIKAEDMPLSEWDRVMNIDIRAAFIVAQAVGKVMIEQKSGRIINIASMYGLIGDQRVLPYLAAKGGVIQMTRGLALEWARHNIQVNAVAPGYVVTPMNAKEFEDEKINKAINSKIPMRRLGQIEDIAGPVVFLASDAARYMTGSVLTVDGGWTCQ
jgi:NAD(P)-dependent dehydrogenase (short-subunit alcohol dehydrogenase family)